MEQKKFKWRSFVSFGMFFSFLVMGISGIILYIAPPGRVFRWIDWHFVFVDLSQWQMLHTIFSYLFIGFAISHIFSMNWKVLFTYFTRKTKAGLRRKRELISSLVVMVLFVAGSLLNFQPFKGVMQLGELGSSYWGEKIDYPPIAHLEEMSIKDIAGVILDIELSDYIQRINDAGYKINDANDSLKDVAAYNHVAPSLFFRKTSQNLKILQIP